MNDVSDERPALTLEALEVCTEMKREKWAGCCIRVNYDMVRCHLAEGQVCYGDWTGPVAPKTYFAGQKNIYHCWVELPDRQICDATRWVFEGREPYIYIGPNDYYSLHSRGSGVW